VLCCWGLEDGSSVVNQTPSNCVAAITGESMGVKGWPVAVVIVTSDPMSKSALITKR
jgi:hypothetical protein